MVEAFKYVFFGFVHFLVIALEFVDFIEQALTVILIAFFLLLQYGKKNLLKCI